jgi:hypothetical protein
LRGSSLLLPIFAGQQQRALTNFQGASAVEKRVKEMTDGVRDLVNIVVNHVKSQNEAEGNKKAVVNAMKGMEGHIGELLRFVFFIFGLRWSDDLVVLSRQFTTI